MEEHEVGEEFVAFDDEAFLHVHEAEVRAERLNEVSDFRDHLHHPFRLVERILVVVGVHDVDEIEQIFVLERLHRPRNLPFVRHRELEIVDRLALRGVVVRLQVLQEDAFRPELRNAFPNVEQALVNGLAGEKDRHVVCEPDGHERIGVVRSQIVSH